MALNIIIFMIVSLSFFYIGYIFGKKKANELPFEEKEYSIVFQKVKVDNYCKMDSFIIKEFTSFCDQYGIKIKDLQLNDSWDCELVVNCTKDQYFLLIQELSDVSKYWIELKKITN